MKARKSVFNTTFWNLYVLNAFCYTSTDPGWIIDHGFSQRNYLRGLQICFDITKPTCIMLSRTRRASSWKVQKL
ncbi:hypothetical protein HOLleu_33778 [Holothuria leucospilota]|uniref:Uncharacterized protein n=1 Tax=Holothuria leucospilota TaxID=206669 RepID=A0A9Q1BHY5_HOLLE|nr:hypothetical protein HOLleu_33778 [Holothuria leucospilota]